MPFLFSAAVLHYLLNLVLSLETLSVCSEYAVLNVTSVSRSIQNVCDEARLRYFTRCVAVLVHSTIFVCNLF